MCDVCVAGISTYFDTTVDADDFMSALVTQVKEWFGQTVAVWLAAIGHCLEGQPHFYIYERIRARLEQFALRRCFETRYDSFFFDWIADAVYALWCSSKMIFDILREFPSSLPAIEDLREDLSLARRVAIIGAIEASCAFFGHL